VRIERPGGAANKGIARLSGSAIYGPDCATRLVLACPRRPVGQAGVIRNGRAPFDPAEAAIGDPNIVRWLYRTLSDTGGEAAHRRGHRGEPAGAAAQSTLYKRP